MLVLVYAVPIRTATKNIKVKIDWKNSLLTTICGFIIKNKANLQTMWCWICLRIKPLLPWKGLLEKSKTSMTKERYFYARTYRVVKNVGQWKVATSIFHSITVTEITCGSPAVKVLNTDHREITMSNLFGKTEYFNIFEVKALLAEH